MNEKPHDKLVIYRRTLEDADFSGRHPRLLSVSGSRLTRCSFSDLQAHTTDLGGGRELTVYRECIFDRARLVEALPGNAMFIDCSFKDVHIENVFCQAAQFVGCVFSGTLRSVVFNAKYSSLDLFGRGQNEYRNNDFTAAKLNDVSFQGGINLAHQRLPAGDDYITIWNARRVLRKVRKQVELWPEKELRDDAEPTLWTLEDICSTGQRDIFVNRSFLHLRRGHPASSTRLLEAFEVAIRPA